MLRQVQWGDVEGCAGEEVAGSLARFWVHVAGTVSKIMPAHAANAAVQAYGAYLLAGGPSARRSAGGDANGG